MIFLILQSVDVGYVRSKLRNCWFLTNSSLLVTLCICFIVPDRTCCSWISCFTWIVFSQNDSRAQVIRDFWKSPGPTLLLKQGHLELAVQDCVQVAFEYFQRGRLLNLSEQPGPVLRHLQRKKKKCLLMLRWSLLCFSLCLCILSCHGAPLKRACLCLLCTLIHING